MTDVLDEPREVEKRCKKLLAEYSKSYREQKKDAKAR
jgi:hypothetical protein